MKQTIEPYPWRDVALAVLPGVVLMGVQFVIAGLPALWKYGWAAEVLALLACLVVIAAALRREGSLTLWSLPAVSIGMVNVINITSSVLDLVFQPSLAEQYAVGRTVLDALILSMIAGMLLIGVWAARRWGGAASLAISGFVGQFSMAIMDPTYALLMIRPETYSPLGVALLDLIPQSLFLIALPVAALRARSVGGQIRGLLGAYAAAQVSMLLISVTHDFAIQGVPGAGTLAEELTYTFTIGPLYAGGFWLILAAITLIYHVMQRTGPQPPSEEAQLTPGLTA